MNNFISAYMGLWKNGLVCIGFILSFTEIYAQRPAKTIIIIIDSVKLDQHWDEFNPGFSIYFSDSMGYKTRDSIYDDEFNYSLSHKKGDKDYIAKAKIHDDSAVLNIPLDFYNGNVLQIKNIYNVKDTLRINKITKREDCHNDTFYTTKYYYYKIKGSPLGNAYKVKHKRTINKSKCRVNKRAEPVYQINGKKYIGSFSEKPGSTNTIITGCGYKPERYYKNPDKFKGKLTRISIQISEYKYFDVISIKL